MRPNNNENRILLTTYIGKTIMTKLHPETAQQIADLFSSIAASGIMADDDADNSAYWLANRCKGIVEMADRFGLFLNTYDLAVETLQKPTFRDAVLTADKI
jgi:hypothetical protein